MEKQKKLYSMEPFGGNMKQKVILKGPVLTRSGYGEQARFALRALQSREDLFDIYVQPLSWGATTWISEQTEERASIDSLIKKTIGFLQQGGKFDMSLQITIPNEFEKMASVNIGYTAGIETTACSAEWLQKINSIIDRVIVVSSFSKRAFIDSSYTGEVDGQPMTLKLDKPIEHVNYAVKEFDSLPELKLDLDYDFNFLSMAQWGPRKNLPNTVKWFIEEFHDEEVGLILKTNLTKNCLIDRELVHSRLKDQFNTRFPDKVCKIYLLHGDMTETEIHSLYKHPKVSAMVALPHGEGFGLPIFEAAYSGIPVVATGWSGHLDFLVDASGKDQFYNVAFDINQVQAEVVWENVLIKESRWAYPREGSAKEQMRKCYEEKKDSSEYALELKERFSKEKMYARFVELMVESAPEETIVNDMDEIERLFAESL
jgi:glycosyltransferase involved in cell wall biosynthesis